MTNTRIVRVADVMEQDYAIVDGVATVAEALAVLTKKNACFLIVAMRYDCQDGVFAGQHQFNPVNQT